MDNGVLKCESKPFGFMPNIRLSKVEFIEFLIETSKTCQDEQIKVQCSDAYLTGVSIHHDGADKTLRGMTVTNMYVDDFYYNLPEPPETDIISVIQSVDYERLTTKRLADVHTGFYLGRLIDAIILDSMLLDYMLEEKDNDDMVAKVTYRCSMPYNNCMHDTNSDKNIPALRRRFRHR